MATLVKIRGLNRGHALGEFARGFRLPHASYQRFPAGVKATLVPTANTQSYTAIDGGTWGNSVKVQTATGTLAVSTSFDSSGNPTILVTAPATATLAANQAVVAAVNADFVASEFVTAAIAGTGAAAHAVVAATNLATGTNVGTGGERINVPITNKATFIVDIDDPKVQRALLRNKNAWVVLGVA